MGAKKKRKNKTTEGLGNATEEGQENGGRLREMRDQKMTMSVMMMRRRKKSNKQEKEKNNTGIIR